MAEHDDDDDDSSSTSTELYEVVDRNEQQQLQQFLHRAKISARDADIDEDRILVKTMLESVGFDTKRIERAIRVFEKRYGTGNYNPDDITQIILKLQEKEEIKRQKRQLLAMNLEPKLAQELLGNEYKPKSKSKTSGYHRGDIVIYRDKMKAQILDKMDDYLQISWPYTKPLYQRAILWINICDIKRRKKEKKKKGIFGKVFDIKATVKDESKSEYKFQKLWKHFVVDDFKQKEDETLQIMKVSKRSLKLKFQLHCGSEYAICGMYEIQNETLETLYNKRKDLILRFSLDADENRLNRLHLWYLLSRTDVIKITTNGFKRKYGVMNTNGFGHKFYLNARDAIDGYGDYRKMARDSDNMQYLLYCSVICGESCLGSTNMKIPKNKANKSYILYETSVENMDLKKNKYYITSQDYQAMPLYIFCVKQKQKQKQKQQKAQYAFDADKYNTFLQQFKYNVQQNVQGAFTEQLQQNVQDQNVPNIPNHPQQFVVPNININPFQQYQQYQAPPPMPPPQHQHQQHQQQQQQQQQHHRGYQRPPRQQPHDHDHHHHHYYRQQRGPQQQQQQQQPPQRQQRRQRPPAPVPVPVILYNNNNNNDNNNNNLPHVHLPQQQQDDNVDMYDSV